MRIPCRSGGSSAGCCRDHRWTIAQFREFLAWEKAVPHSVEDSLEDRIIIRGRPLFLVYATGIELWSWPARTHRRFREDDPEPGPETARYLVQLTSGDENRKPLVLDSATVDELKGDLKFHFWKTVRQVHHPRPRRS